MLSCSLFLPMDEVVSFWWSKLSAVNCGRGGGVKKRRREKERDSEE